MRTPAIYDLQTERVAHPGTARFTVGTEGDVALPVAEPWGNRGGSDNIASLLADVDAEHVAIEVDGGTARVVPRRRTATVYVDRRPVDGDGRRVRNGTTIVLGRGKSDLWEGYRVQVFP